jgi:integrase
MAEPVALDPGRRQVTTHRQSLPGPTSWAREPPLSHEALERAAVADIAAAGRLSPHSLRHAFATGARESGVPLEDVQDAMGHADPRTTRRYDRDRHNRDRDPAHVLGRRRASRRDWSTDPAGTDAGVAVTAPDTGQT